MQPDGTAVPWNVRDNSPVFAVEKIPHRLASCFVDLGFGLAFLCAQVALVRRLGNLGSTAFWAAICKAGLVRLKFELLTANRAYFDRKRHL